MMIFSDTVRYWARWQGPAIAVRFGDREITWAELNRSGDELAAGLVAQGVERGDRVGLLLSNRPEFIETVIACMHLGAIAVPFNLRFTAHELAFVVDNADCTVVVTEASLHAGLSLALEQRPGLIVADADDGTLDALRVAGGSAPKLDIDAAEPLFICFTSGTTGDPKGAVLTNRSWFYASMCRALQGGINRNDRLLLPFPMAFTGGLALLMVVLWSGATLVLEPSFDPTRALSIIEAQRITVFMAVPTIFQTMADHPKFEETDMSSIRCASSGGATVPVSLLQTFLARGIPMTQTYSLTEVSASGITLPYDQSLERIGSCGVPAMHSEARIVDADGNTCPPGAIGEIAIRGPEVMSGYWRNPEATAATLRDGWCHTGDLGTMDEDGYFFVVDRAKDMLITGGLNVYPAEIERQLSGLPGVLELAVIGVPDARWGETPAVIAVSNGSGITLDGAAVLAACAGFLADFKTPRYLVVRDAPLPRNMSGKVLKAALRLEYVDLQTSGTPLR
jgi:fatty-acyl-CoA synthase